MLHPLHRRPHRLALLVLWCAFAPFTATPVAAQTGLGCANNLPTSAPTHVVTNYPTPGASGIAGFPQNGMPWFYAPGITPTYNNYPASGYSTSWISPASVLPRMTTLCNGTDGGFFSAGKVPFSFYNWDAGGAWVTALLSEPPVPGWIGPGTGRVRILHGIQIDDSFVTIMLPPNWSQYTATTHPIAYESFYDVNDNLFNSFGHSGLIGRIVGQSGLLGRRGAIGVLWNSGATFATAAANTRAQAQFISVLGWLAAYAKAEPFSIYMVGRSRGGTVPLIFASSGSNAYLIKYILSIAPATKFGTHLQNAGATMLGQFGAPTEATGFNDAWLPGWLHPYTGQTAKEAVSQVLFGAPVAALDGSYSPISPAQLTNIKSKGTKVLLLAGTHDKFIPYGTQMEYIEAMQSPLWPAPLEAHAVIGGGHLLNADFMNGLFDGVGVPFNAGERFLSAIMAEIGVPGGSSAITNTGPDRIRFYRANKGAGFTLMPGLNANTERPFTIEVPYKVWTGMPVEVFISGHPGTQVELWTNLHGYLPTYTIDPTGTLFISASTVGWPPIGALIYGVAIKTPSMAAFQPLSIAGTGGLTAAAETQPQCGYPVLHSVIDTAAPPYIVTNAAAPLLNVLNGPPCAGGASVGVMGETSWGLAKISYP